MGECVEQIEKALSLHEAVIRRAESFKKVQTAYQEQEHLYKEAIQLYNNARRAVAIKEIKSRGQTWCTRCRGVVQEKDAILLLLTGTRRAKEVFERFSELHRMCGDCKEKTHAKNGRYGKWDENAKAQEEFHTHSVITHTMIREQGSSIPTTHYYAEIPQPVMVSGHGWKNEEEFHDPTKEMIDAIAEELGLPPERTYEDFADTIEAH